MKRFWLAFVVFALLGGQAVMAGPFNKGIGSAMIYGPYTGGHGYSYNTAYSYGFAWSSADTWRKDVFAYPGGIYPYRPEGRPIYYRVFPKPAVAPISVPGEDGLPVLVHPGAAAMQTAEPGSVVAPYTPGNVPATPTFNPATQPGAEGMAAPVTATPTSLQPASGVQEVDRPANIRVQVPENAEVWFDRERMSQSGTDRMYLTPALIPGKMHIYTVRARWMEDGREVEQFRVVGVRAGETAKLTFGAARP